MFPGFTPRPAGTRRAVPPSSPPQRRSARVLRRVAPAAISALAIVPLVPTAAQAALGAVGPIDASTQFPAWYSDANGLQLELCLTNATICLAGADELVPAHAAGLDAEAFYWQAEATVDGIDVANALEAAYVADGAGQEAVFVRTQISNQDGGMTPGALYTVTDPYGTLTCRADAGGFIKNNACRTETTPVERDFVRPLAGRIGPFLTWDTYGAATGAPPAGYIGDNQTPHRVVGSPTGFNKVRIVGPDVNGTATTADDCVGYTGTQQCAETSLFVVQGKVAPTSPPVVVDTTAPPAPTLSLASGAYPSGQSLSISDTEAGATIRYTFDTGTAVPADPVATDAQYTAPISLTSARVIKAAAFDAAGNRSPIIQGAYTLTATTPPPTTPPPAPTTRTVTLNATADTMARQIAAGTASGTATSLRSDTQATVTGSRESSYLKFTVPALAAGERITAARLSLNVNNSTTNGPHVWRTGTTWTEGGVTWRAQPARTGTASVGNFATMGTGRVSTPITGVTAAGTVSFQLHADVTDGLGFTSRETTSRPQLVLTITKS
jgi:hypothetical protein